MARLYVCLYCSFNTYASSNVWELPLLSYSFLSLTLKLSM